MIEFASPSARALLERYLGVENGRVPEDLLARRELELVPADRRLHLRIARTGGLHVLVLDERDARVERLTARERQILEHVASGKENNEIALTLRIAPPRSRSTSSTSTSSSASRTGPRPPPFSLAVKR